MSAEEKLKGVADAKLARAELYSTLTQLKDRLNYAQRVDNAVAEAKRRITEEKRSNPLGFAAGVAGVASIAGLAAWGIASAVAKRFR